MRIGVDARPLREKQTSGIPRYVASLLTALAKIDSKNEYVLYAHKEFEASYGDNFTRKYGAVTRYGSVWMQAELPWWLNRDKIDLFWGTQHILPLSMSHNIKSVLTVHDLVHYVFPETMRPMNLLINKLIIPPSIRRTDAIVADTEWTLNDVRRFLNPQSKVMEVVHLGINPFFYPRPKPESRQLIKERYGLNQPFLLTLGTFEPRKNIKGTFRAFSLLADKIPHHLVVVGQKGWKNKDVVKDILKSHVIDRIHFMGYVEDPLIPVFYSAADAFIFPSLYEGFGLPPLEAMACGTPVVCSNVSSIPEVVGHAAELVDPQKPEDIARGILSIVDDSKHRDQLTAVGLEQVKRFRWETAAQKMLNVFQSVRQ